MTPQHRKTNWRKWRHTAVLSCLTIALMYGFLFAGHELAAWIVTIAGMLLIWRLDPTYIPKEDDEQ